MASHRATPPRRPDARAAPVLVGFRSGGTTLDVDDQAGNPFARALIELEANPQPRQNPAFFAGWQNLVRPQR